MAERSHISRCLAAMRGRGCSWCCCGDLVVPLDVAGTVDLATCIAADMQPRLVVGDVEVLAPLSAEWRSCRSRIGNAARPATEAPATDALTHQTRLQLVFTSGTFSIWFFVGIMTLSCGLVLLPYGGWALFSGYEADTVLHEMHPTIWWGLMLTLFGGSTRCVSERAAKM